jgi:RimJ/RimL family protein N-acetyltransferase
LLKGKRVTLRGLELEDTQEILKHFNDMEVRHFLGGPIPISKPEEEEFIRGTWTRRKTGRDHVFGIELHKSQLLIGCCELTDISPVHRGAELGIVIFNKKYWGQGFGTEALHLLLDYGFNSLNLHRIFLRVNEDNPRAIRAYEKVGFQQVARYREAIFREGKYIDEVLMDILAEEYKLAQS